MLATTSSKFEVVGTGSLEKVSRMADAEEIFTSSVVAMALLSRSKGLVVTSADGRAMVGVDAKGSASSVVVGLLVSVGTKLSSLMIADKLSTASRDVAILETSDVTLSRISVSLLKIVELGTISASEANGVSTADETEFTSLSSG